MEGATHFVEVWSKKDFTMNGELSEMWRLNKFLENTKIAEAKTVAIFKIKPKPYKVVSVYNNKCELVAQRNLPIKPDPCNHAHNH